MMVAFYKTQALVLTSWRLNAAGEPVYGDVLNGAWSFNLVEGNFHFVGEGTTKTSPAPQFVCSREVPYSSDYNQAIFDAYQTLTAEEKALCGL